MESVGSVLADKETISIAPSWRSRGYTAIANAIILNPHLSAGAKVVYCYLLIRCFSKDFSYPSNETMMNDLSLGSKSSIVKYKQELLREGLMTQKRRRNKTTLYFLNP